MKFTTILTIILFIVVGMYYFGVLNIYDYKAWLRILILTSFILLINFIYHRIKDPNKINPGSINIDEIKEWAKKSSPVDVWSNIPFKKKHKRVNKTENKCRGILEKIYKAKFPSCRPDFLKNPDTKHNLELDCYNKDLNIALEYNGEQHYFYVPTFHKTKKAFYSQVFRDDWKRNKCKEMGIHLIEIPYWAQHVLDNYIHKELRKKGLL